MPPKAKPGAKPGAKAKAAPAAATPEPAPPAKPAGPEPISVSEAEARLAFLEDEEWSELAGVESPHEAVAKVLEALLLLLGDPDPATWATATAALQKPAALIREIKALGPWGCAETQVERVAAALDAAQLGRLCKPSADAAAKAAAKAKAAVKAKAKAAPAAPAEPPPGANAALVLGQLTEAYLAERAGTKPPSFPMVWPKVPYLQLHRTLQQAMCGRQQACVVCPNEDCFRATMLHLETAGSAVCDLRRLQAQMNLSKSLSIEGARAHIGRVIKDAMQRGLRLVLLLGESPPNLRRFCDSQQFPMEVFDFDKLGDAAKALGLESPSPGFHLVSVAELRQARAEKQLPQVLPSVDETAVFVLDEGTLPAASALAEETQQSRPICLRSALRLLALEAAAAAPAAAAAGATAAPGSSGSAPSPVPEDADGPAINREDFEYIESFGEDWQDRWQIGPSTKDENGKEIRAGLITPKIIKYPANPKDAKMCFQLMGGMPNAACTGIWTTFAPLIRPTEVEFEFTVNGKVDLPNACVVFTESPLDVALPDCKVGVQFIVRGAMQLCGGGGNLVRISNDGKLQNDKWNKVIMKIDWNEKMVVAQVDTRGKGYAPAIQTVPFRDDTCRGFGCLFIYNTDMQGTCWFSSLRIKQCQADMDNVDNEALDARRELAQRLKEREYQRAVDRDMEVGMKMGAISCTKEHGMNLAEEQRANNNHGVM